MKKNKFMFRCGLLLTIGSFFIVPLIFGIVIFFTGSDLNYLFNSGEESSMIILIVAIGASVLIPLIGAGLLVGAVLIPLFSKMNANSKIIAEGVPAEAKILEINSTGTRINNNPVIEFLLEVYPQTRPSFTARTSQTVSMIHLPSYQPGNMVNVKYEQGTNNVAIVGIKT